MANLDDYVIKSDCFQLHFSIIEFYKDHYHVFDTFGIWRHLLFTMTS